MFAIEVGAPLSYLMLFSFLYVIWIMAARLTIRVLTWWFPKSEGDQ